MTLDQDRPSADHPDRPADGDEVAQLRHAVASNRTIGIAVGILVERYRLTPEAAFAFLSRHSQTTNRKVRDLAEELIATGEVPGESTDVSGWLS